MKIRHLKTPSLLVSTLALTLSIVARADDSTSTIKFSDPSKPGTLKINLGRGELNIQGTDAKEISIKSDTKISGKTRKDGLRELTSAASYGLNEKDNVVVLDAMENWGRGGGGDFKITVPRNTSVVVQNSIGGGEVKCSNLSGDVEITNNHGSIRLDDVSGSVVANTMNGEIKANIRELHDGKPLSFTSMNGEIVVRIPDKSKANVRLRTQNGSVLTDFEDTALVTKVESTSTPGFKGKGGITIRNTRGLSTEIQDAIRDATEISATAVRQALEAVKEGFEASKIDMDEARKRLDEARKDIERARRDAERDQRRAASEARANRNTDEWKPAPAAAPAPPAPGAPAVAVTAGDKAWTMAKLPVPTITGGKLVTGSLNGGGPEISIATMNGDVVLRKLESK